ncbi:phosphotransferase family protein [Ornithinimicrobium cryptoxanthini]|uniref:phosphotransferase family protein n=1 Tax=Ornithinimicrobium cryptoxanthini TaxID=2934161 RepID=UPI0021183640|nr:aminoglycoside phosphotransferase family protein [Ornithinimicrobium cryptoxanthini]
MTLTTRQDVAALAAAHPQWFDDGRGVPSDPSPEATLIGRGESYAAWLVISRALADVRDPAGPRRIVVRVPHRLDELPRPMAEEFAALAAAPEGLGPRPIHLEPGDGTRGTGYQVQEFVPGQVRPATGWTDELLAAHARQLARLHERSYEGHGALTAAQLEPRISMVEQGESGLAWWGENYPELTAAADVARLWPRVRRLFEDTEPEFERLARFALTHGDAAVPNILVSGGVPRYVDWEWAMIGDPARDLAFIGGDVWLEPWYLELGRDRLERYLGAYVEAAGVGDPASLAVRARAWLVNEVFFVALHFRRQAQRGAGAEYAGRADTLLARLDVALDRFSR